MDSKVQDIKHYGIDAEEKLISMLSEELAKSIDKEIIRGLGFEPELNKRRKKKISDLLNNDR